MKLKQICTVASDYLGLPEKDCLRRYDVCIACGYYNQKEDDPEHPSVLPMYCGNCIHWVIVEEK